MVQLQEDIQVWAAEEDEEDDEDEESYTFGPCNKIFLVFQASTIFIAAHVSCWFAFCVATYWFSCLLAEHRMTCHAGCDFLRMCGLGYGWGLLIVLDGALLSLCVSFRLISSLLLLVPSFFLFAAAFHTVFTHHCRLSSVN